MNKEKAIKEIKKASESFYACDYIKTNVAESIISKINEPQKVVIPKFVAEWIENHKGDYNNWDKEARADFVFRAIYELFRFGEGLRALDFTIDEKFSEWTTKNAYEFIIAILLGYTVEKEKLYTVEIPNPNGDNNRYGLCKVDGRIIIGSFVFGFDRATNAKLTESEIKQDFEWAWQWAKPVEEN